MIAWQLATAGPALATAGDFDPEFGQDGKVFTDFSYFRSASANALAIQADGKLVAAGSTQSPSGGYFYEFALARYTPSGGLDESFGTGGKVTTDFSGNAYAYALVVQADGKLVAAGKAWIGGSDPDFALVRYNPDGTLDPTFGTGGKVTTNFGGSDTASALALQPDGKLVAAGSTLARYNTDGTLDTTFGVGGTVTTDFAGNALVVQTNGRLVAAGSTNSDFALARYKTNGTLDTGFGTGGKVTTDFAGLSDVANALVVQDGKLIAAGYARIRYGNEPYPLQEFALARYNPNGTLDADFGTGGKVAPIMCRYCWVNALAVQNDDKPVAAGTLIQPSYANTKFVLTRYQAH